MDTGCPVLLVGSAARRGVCQGILGAGLDLGLPF
jgi:hypothetical protein